MLPDFFFFDGPNHYLSMINERSLEGFFFTICLISCFRIFLPRVHFRTTTTTVQQQQLTAETEVCGDEDPDDSSDSPLEPQLQHEVVSNNEERSIDIKLRPVGCDRFT